MKAFFLILVAVFFAGVVAGHSLKYNDTLWKNELVATKLKINKRFRQLQLKHGAVAVATDWSHCVRLNGEIIRLKKEE